MVSPTSPGSPLRSQPQTCARAESARLLVVEVHAGTSTLLLVSAHCPHTAKAKEALAFLEDLEAQIAFCSSAGVILVGADLNARLPEQHTSVTGDIAFGAPDDNGNPRPIRDCTLVTATPTDTQVEARTGSTTSCWEVN